MTDEQSLAAALADDLDGHFEQLVRIFQDRLYGFTLRLTGSARDAEEATQDTFVRAYRALQRYPVERRREVRVRPWLYQIAAPPDIQPLRTFDAQDYNFAGPGGS